MNINYQYSDIRPLFVTCISNLGRNEYTINFNVEELSKNERSVGKEYRYQSVKLPPGIYDRKTVITSLIYSHYSKDEMEAIINNYLFDKKDKEAIAEFNEMQSWRIASKQIADQFEAAILENQ